jgi:hypothetical protein
VQPDPATAADREAFFRAWRLVRTFGLSWETALVLTAFWHDIERHPSSGSMEPGGEK